MFRKTFDLESVPADVPIWITADSRRTIADLPEWNLVDWASIFLSGRSSILTALWARVSSNSPN